MKLRSIVVSVAALAMACGPNARQTPGDDDDDGSNGSNGGGGDGGGGMCSTSNNGAGSGSDCGMVQVPLSSPIALPDTNQGNGNGKCTTNAQCASPSAPTCVMTGDNADGPGMCALTYTDTLDFVGFCPGETLDDTSKLISVCATMEHTWAGDIEVDLISPDGKSIALHQFPGRFGTPIFLGHPNYCDSDANPVAGSGYEYCWTQTGTSPLTKTDNSDCGAPGGCESWAGNTTWCPDGPSEDTGDQDGPPFPVAPAGNYKPDQAFSGLQGAQLNGNWTFRVTDLYALDNGYLFSWSIQFDPSLIPDCSSPIIQ
ncbi:MAG TPA: proprotein convertase P-domain-containing protein [Kofleriaceae bacterium]|jgi:hypothetical protein